MSFPSI